MSARKAKEPERLPWEDRWTEPTLEQLLAPVDENRRKVVDALVEQIGAFEGVERSIVWYGKSWKWTLQFDVFNDEGEELGVLAYIVPVPAQPILSIPLTEEQIGKLPLRRLNKYVRDGIRYAKRGVDIHWAVWTPSANTEVEQLLDLVKRKHKMLRAGVESEEAK